MFGMGWQEILMIMVIAVLVIGPEQLPQVARSIGKMVAQFRRATNDLRDSINREFNDQDEFKEFKEFQHSLDSEIRGIGYSAQNYVETEVAKEEAALKRLEEEVEGFGEHAAQDDGAEPKAQAEAWMPDAGEAPAEQPEGEGEATVDQAAAGDATAGSDPDEPVERTSSRKETA